MIQINDLQFAYSHKSPLFDGLTVTLNGGSITGLLGKNGAGKTTLLKLLTGLLHSQSGEISVLSHAPRKREVSMLKDVFFVTEEFSFPSISITDYQKAHSPFYPQFDYGLLHRILKEFELDPSSHLLRLSHGERKKFLIAFALATRCRLIVLDEPTNGLDIPSKSLFRKVLAGILDDDQLIIISSHQVRDVENLIDKILILDKGEVIFHKTIEDISQKVCFISGTSAEAEGAIYSEMIPGGHRLMVPKGSSETEVDIELLFNAITKGKKIE